MGPSCNHVETDHRESIGLQRAARSGNHDTITYVECCRWADVEISGPSTTIHMTSTSSYPRHMCVLCHIECGFVKHHIPELLPTLMLNAHHEMRARAHTHTPTHALTHAHREREGERGRERERGRARSPDQAHYYRCKNLALYIRDCVSLSFG